MRKRTHFLLLPALLTAATVYAQQPAAQEKPAEAGASASGTTGT